MSLREVINSERILACRSLIKEDIDFWKEDLGTDKTSDNFDALMLDLDQYSDDILESSLNPDSEEVATTIAGYISKKLTKRSKCDACKSCLTSSDRDLGENHYLTLLSRGGLTVPSSHLAGFSCTCFAMLDYVDKFVQKHNVVNVRAALEVILAKFAPKSDFTCPNHIDWGG